MGEMGRKECSHGEALGQCSRCCPHGVSLRSGCLTCRPENRGKAEAYVAARAALAAARDDVLRAALKDCETHPGDERLCNEDDVCLCDLCAAVDRWQKLEGSR